MKRPQTKAGKPAAGRTAHAGPRVSQRDTGKILATVSDLTKKRQDRAMAPAEPARGSKSTRPPRTPRVLKVAKDPRPAKSARATKSPRASRLFDRLTPEAARFRAYSRQRRAVLLSVIGSFTALILLMLASMFTPMLAVETIKVAGLDRLKPAQVQAALKSQLGTPLPMVRSEVIGDKLKGFPLIESFSVRSQPPHTLVVNIIERTPICIVTVNGSAYLYDPAGVRIGPASGSDSYPQLAINGDPASSREYQLAIEVLLALPASLLPRVYSIDAKSKDNVSMQLRGNAGQAIVWGDASNSVLKSKVLAALIRNHKKSDRVTFDVSSPNAPVVRY